MTGIETPVDKPLKVAIVGTAPASRMMAPYADDSWQIWTCSGGNRDVLPRVNIWFELHATMQMMSPEDRGHAEPFYAWLKAKSEADAFQVVMLEAGTAVGGDNKFVPKAIPYPRDQMLAEFGRNWFTSSVAWMMALAMSKGAVEIGLFGVDMAADQEHYEAQRAGCTHFIELAEARGIPVHVPYESCLMAARPLYGYWEGTPFGRRVNALIAVATAAYNEAAGQEAQAHERKLYLAASLEQLRYFQRTWVDGSEIEFNLGQFADDFMAKAPPLAPAGPQGGSTAAQAPNAFTPFAGGGTGEIKPAAVRKKSARKGPPKRSKPK